MNLNVDISSLPADIRRTYKQLQVLHAEKQIQNKAKNDFLSFVKCVWPDFIEGSHHRHVAKKFNDLSTGKLKRLIVNMPPRHTKSEFASYLLPSWMVGRNPKLKIIQATHTGELAIRFGRKAKHLIDSEEYKKIFINIEQDIYKSGGITKTIDKAKILKKISTLEYIKNRRILESNIYEMVLNLSKIDLQIEKVEYFISNKNIDILKQENMYKNGLLELFVLDESIIEVVEHKNEKEDL